MKFDPPIRRLSVFAGSRPPAILPAIGSPAASNPSARLRSALAAGRLRRRSDRGPAMPITPPSDKVAYTAWKEWTKFGRATVVYGGHGQRLHQPPRHDRAQRAAEQHASATIGALCGRPQWNGSLGQALVGRLRHLGDGPVGLQRRRSSRATAATAATSRRSTIASAPRAAHRSGSTRRTNTSPKPGDLVCSGSAGPTWRCAPIRAPRIAASTTPPPTAISSPTCAAAMSTQSAAT